LTSIFSRKELLEYVRERLTEGGFKEALEAGEELLRKYEEGGRFREAFKLSGALHFMQGQPNEMDKELFVKTIDSLSKT